MHSPALLHSLFTVFINKGEFVTNEILTPNKFDKLIK